MAVYLLKEESEHMYLRLWAKANEEVLPLSKDWRAFAAETIASRMTKVSCRGRKETPNPTRNYHRETGCGDADCPPREDPGKIEKAKYRRSSS